MKARVIKEWEMYGITHKVGEIMNIPLHSPGGLPMISDRDAFLLDNGFIEEMKEPLIEKESHRGVLRAAARMSGTDTAHVCKSDYAESVIFEFKGKEFCSVELMDIGINTAHDGWYTIAELCGEEEE